MFEIGLRAGRACDASTGCAAVRGCSSDVGVVSSQRRSSDRQ